MKASFLLYTLAIFLLSCSHINFNHRVSKIDMTELSQAQKFEVRRILTTQHNVSPSTDITTYTQKQINLIDSHKTISLNISSKQLTYHLGYKISGIIFSLSQSSDKKPRKKTLGLCTYEMFLAPLDHSYSNLSIFGNPVQSKRELRLLTNVFNYSKVIPLSDSDPDHVFQTCVESHQKRVAYQNIRKFYKLEANLRLKHHTSMCLPPSQAERQNNAIIRNQGDPTCQKWFAQLSLVDKEHALARCIKMTDSDHKLGTCSIRSKPNQPIALFLDANGHVTYDINAHIMKLLSAPSTTQYLCDETVFSRLSFQKNSHDSDTYIGSCRPPDPILGYN